MKNDGKGLGANYRKLVAANCINRFGDAIDALALTWLVYAVTGSAFWSAIYYACNQLPSVLVQPFAGAIVETKNKRRVMVITDILRGAAVALLAVLYQVNAIHPLVTIVFTLFVSTVEAFRVPAGNAFVSLVVADEQYEAAISKNASFTTIASLVGTAAAGLIIAVLGTSLAIITDAVTFFLSAALLASTKTAEAQEFKKNAGSLAEQCRRYGELFADGLDYAQKSTVVMGLIVLVMVFNGVLAPINSLIAPLVSGYYGLGSGALSAFSIALSIGMAAAGFTFSPLADKVKSPRKMLSIGALLTGGIYLLLIFVRSITDSSYLLLLTLILAGMAIGYIVTANTTMLTVDFMRRVAKTHIARIAALYNSVASASVPVLAFVFGIAAGYASTAEIFVCSSIFCLIAGLVMLLVRERVAD